MTVHTSVYVDGRLHSQAETLDAAYTTLRTPGSLTWIDLGEPDPNEIASLARELGIHPLAVQDTIAAHQHPKIEHFGDMQFTVLRPARYLEDEERVEFGELHVFTGPGVVVTIRHGEATDLSATRERVDASPDLVRLGPLAVLYVLLDDVVSGYVPVAAGLANDIEEIEDQLFGEDPAVARRIYQLFGEVLAFQRATRPLAAVLEALGSTSNGSGTDQPEAELRRHLRHVRGRVTRIVERADSFWALLQNALTVNATIVAQRQNEEMRAMTELGLQQNDQVKKISAWAAILFAPSLVGTVYGMNFRHMPELAWQWGYPAALGLMVVGSGILFTVFRARKWL